MQVLCARSHHVSLTTDQPVTSVDSYQVSTVLIVFWEELAPV